MSTYELLADRQAIVDLTVLYCWSIDHHEFERLREVFLPDAIAKLGDERSGIDSIIERISTALTPLDGSQHIVANHQIHVDGDKATCRCYFQAQHVHRGVDGGSNYIIAGQYEDELVRTTAGWRISRRVLVPTWSDGNPAVVRGNRPASTL